MSWRDKVALGLTVVAVILIPGLANVFLGNMGYPTLGTVVWAVGYGTGAVLVWFIYIRPLDISAPGGVNSEDE